MQPRKVPEHTVPCPTLWVTCLLCTRQTPINPPRAIFVTLRSVTLSFLVIRATHPARVQCSRSVGAVANSRDFFSMHVHNQCAQPVNL